MVGIAVSTACMASKTISEVFGSVRPHWVGNGFHVYPVFSDKAFTNDISPFLMFDYGAPNKFEPTSEKKGVGMHPHRGFETVTIAFQGEVEHGDSMGSKGTIGPGDVQWMTAGRGIVHEEFISKSFLKKGGMVEMAQLWVNLPQRLKMTPPKYQPITSASIPVVNLPEEAGSVRVISGQFNDVKGPANTFTPVHVLDCCIKSGKSVKLEVENGLNTLVFVRRGAINLCNAPLKMPQIALLSLTGGEVSIATTSNDDAEILILSGQPFNEPIASYGPFVMNTQDEIRQAMNDYNSGKFGQ